MHELLSYLNRRGAVTILTMAQHGLIGDMRTPADLTYLSDGVVLLRYFEAGGRGRRGGSPPKKRGGAPEGTNSAGPVKGGGPRAGGPPAGVPGRGPGGAPDRAPP